MKQLTIPAGSVFQQRHAQLYYSVILAVLAVGFIVWMVYTIDTKTPGVWNTYHVPLSYGQTHEQLAAMGRNDEVSEGFTAKYFPLEQSGSAAVDITLKSISVESFPIGIKPALAKLKAEGCLPATPLQLLMLGKAYPNLQLGSPIISVGNVTEISFVDDAGVPQKHNAVVGLVGYKPKDFRRVEVFGAGVLGFRKQNVQFAAVCS